jgi:hypothetical protein
MAILYEMTFQVVQLKARPSHESYDEILNDDLNRVLLLKYFLPYDYHSFLKSQGPLPQFLECQTIQYKDCWCFCLDPGFYSLVLGFHFQFIVFLAILQAT